MRWVDGHLTGATVYTSMDGPVRIRAENVYGVHLGVQSIDYKTLEGDIIEFDAQAGKAYTFTF